MTIFEEINQGKQAIKEKQLEIENINDKIIKSLDDIYIQDVVVKNNQLIFIIYTFYNPDPHNTYCLTAKLFTEIKQDQSLETHVRLSNGVAESGIILNMLEKENREPKKSKLEFSSPILLSNYSDVYSENLKEFTLRAGKDVINNFDKILLQSCGLERISKNEYLKEHFKITLEEGIKEFSDLLSVNQPEKTTEAFRKAGVNFHHVPKQSLIDKMNKSLALNLESNLTKSESQKPKVKI